MLLAFVVLFRQQKRPLNLVETLASPRMEMRGIEPLS